MSVTLAVFQLPMFWLNAAAIANIPRMLVTLAVFHLEMSSLNAGLTAKRVETSVAALTSQSPIGPYSAVAVALSVAHMPTVVRMLVFVMGAAA